MIHKLNTKALERLVAERTQQAAHRQALERAWANKLVVLGLYGGRCVRCEDTRAEELFLVLRDHLLDVDATILKPGKAHVLGAIAHQRLYDQLIGDEAPRPSYAVYCWRCFKTDGRRLRRSKVIVHPKAKRAVPGMNCPMSGF